MCQTRVGAALSQTLQELSCLGRADPLQNRHGSDLAQGVPRRQDQRAGEKSMQTSLRFEREIALQSMLKSGTNVLERLFQLLGSCVPLGELVALQVVKQL